MLRNDNSFDDFDPNSFDDFDPNIVADIIKDGGYT
jgi:hypothetical protein